MPPLLDRLRARGKHRGRRLDGLQLQERLVGRAARRERSDAAATDRARRDAAGSDFRREVGGGSRAPSPRSSSATAPCASTPTAPCTRPIRWGSASRSASRNASPSWRRSSRSTRRAGPIASTRAAQFFTSATPLEMTHTVFMIDEPDKIVPFYTERLGFIASDSYPGRGYFLRGGASNHHHNLFLLNVGKKRGFHHLAFELSSIHELFGGGLNMTRRGWRTALGPGRHPVSSCYFWYFHSPCGGAAEYDFDSDIVDERWVPGQFQQISGSVRRMVPRRRAWRTRCSTRASKPATRSSARVDTGGAERSHHNHEQDNPKSTKTYPARGCSTRSALARATT